MNPEDEEMMDHCHAIVDAILEALPIRDWRCILADSFGMRREQIYRGKQPPMHIAIAGTVPFRKIIGEIADQQFCKEAGISYEMPLPQFPVKHFRFSRCVDDCCEYIEE